MTYVPDHHLRERQEKRRPGQRQDQTPKKDRTHKPVFDPKPVPTTPIGAPIGTFGVSTDTASAALVADDILRRIKKWRNVASWTGQFPNAVAAIDHYLDKTGTFVEIPESKVKRVRQESEVKHMAQAVEKMRLVALPEAAAQWIQKNGYPTKGGQLHPSEVEIVLHWQSGSAAGGVTDDNLTYFGTMIRSEIHILVRQTSEPKGLDDGPVHFELSVMKWKSWAVDNYDWEGDKKFGIFTSFGLPTQKEMNHLQQVGLAKPYQRSSRSWVNTRHGMDSWQTFAASLATMKAVGGERLLFNKNQDKQRKDEKAAGALPSPPAAEDVLSQK